MERETMNVVGYAAWVMSNTVLYFWIFKLLQKIPTRTEMVQLIYRKYRNVVISSR